MKYRVLSLIVILMAFLGLNVNAAAEYEYSISPGDAFSFAKRGDDLTQIAEKLNTTNDELNSYFDQNGIIYFAISDSTKSQIQISTYSNEFSEKVSDISMLDDKALDKFANSFNVDSDSIVTNNGRKFVCIKNTNDANYTVTQYITIYNNQTFYFTGYNEGQDTSKEISSAFSTFKLNQNNANSEDYDILSTIIIIGIIVFSIIAVVMIIGIIRIKLKESTEIEELEN